MIVLDEEFMVDTSDFKLLDNHNFFRTSWHTCLINYRFFLVKINYTLQSNADFYKISLSFINVWVYKLSFK